MGKKYESLRTIAELIKIGAFVVLFAGLYISIAPLTGANVLGIASTFGVFIISIVVTIIGFVNMLAISALIYVVLDTEENTRRSAELSKEAHSTEATK